MPSFGKATLRFDFRGNLPGQDYDALDNWDNLFHRWLAAGRLVEAAGRGFEPAGEMLKRSWAATRLATASHRRSGSARRTGKGSTRPLLLLDWEI